jgi:uncharacterized protein YkwD
MRNSRLFALSAFALLVMAFVGMINLGSPPAVSVEAIRQPALLTTTTTTTISSSAGVTDQSLVPDLTDLGTTTSSTTTTAPASTDAGSRDATASTEAKAEPDPPTTEARTTPEAGPNPEFEGQFASKINSYRSSEGLGDLRRDGSLDSRARDWAKTMADNGSLSHSDLGNLLPPWSSAAENVGMGGSVSALFDALRGSSGHRQNMLGDYSHFGLGVWVDSDGIIWTAHVFTS